MYSHQTEDFNQRRLQQRAKGPDQRCPNIQSQEKMNITDR